MRSVARGRMINRLKRDSTVLLNQTVWRQTEVCISISTVASLGVHKITTFFRETSSQDVYWVEPVEACEHRDKHFYFTVFFLCPVELFSTPADYTHIYHITSCHDLLERHCRNTDRPSPFLVLSPHACRHPVPLYWQPCTWLPTIVAWHTCVITVTTHDVSKRKFL